MWLKKIRIKSSIITHRFFISFSKVKPVFIVGCGHSGTSILLRMLGAHPEAHAITKETNIVRNDQLNFYKNIKLFNSEAEREGKTIWIEKTPRHIHGIGKILSWLPQAKVLLIIRDGRDVALSLKKRFGNLEMGINRWVQDNEAGRPFWSHPRVHICTYEQLIADNERTLSELMAFLGKKFDPVMLRYYDQPARYYSDKITKPNDQSGDLHDQFRNWQINQPLMDGRYKWMQELDKSEIELITKIAGSLLTEFGYEI